MSPIRVAIAGVGKIARDQHVPSIAANPRLRTGGDREPPRPHRGRSGLSRHRIAARKGRGPRCRGALHAARAATRRGTFRASRRQACAARKAARRDAVRTRRPRGAGRKAARLPVRHLAFALCRRRRRRKGLAGRPHDPLGRASTGRRMCADGIPDRPGSGSRAASACSIRASTRCRSSPKSCRCRSILTSATLLFPQNRAQPIAADLVFADASAAGGRARPSTGGRPARRPGTSTSSTDDGELVAAVRRREPQHPRHACRGRPRRRVCAHLQPIREADHGARERRRPASAAPCR